MTASGDRVRIWRTVDHKQVAVLRDHSSAVTGASFSPNGRMIATWDEEVVRLWRVSTQRRVEVIRTDQNGVVSVSFSPDSKLIATTGEDGTTRVWDTHDGRLAADLPSHLFFAYDAQFSPDGTMIATTGADGITHLVQATKREAPIVLRHNDFVDPARFSPDGKVVATASGDGTARLWDARTGRQRLVLRSPNELALHVNAVRDVDFRGDGKLLVTTEDDGVARIWSTQNGALRSVLGQKSKEDTPDLRAKFSPDGGVVATFGNDTVARLWHTDGRPTAVLGPGHINVLDFSSDGKLLVTGSDSGSAQLRKSKSGETVETLYQGDASVTAAGSSSDGRFIAAASEDGDVRVWRVPNRQPLLVLARQLPIGITLSPDGTMIVTVEADGNARIWRTADGERLSTLIAQPGSASFGVLQPPENAIVSAVFSHDGKLVLTAHENGTARIWQAANGEQLTTLRGGKQALSSAVFSPTRDKHVVTASGDGTARIFSCSGCGSHRNSSRVPPRSAA